MTNSTLLDRYFTPARVIPRKVALGTGTVIALMILIAWGLTSYTGLISEDFLPSPGSVWGSFVKKFSNGSLQQHIGVKAGLRLHLRFSPGER